MKIKERTKPIIALKGDHTYDMKDAHKSRFEHKFFFSIFHTLFDREFHARILLCVHLIKTSNWIVCHEKLLVTTF
jgi:hypothetical protein